MMEGVSPNWAPKDRGNWNTCIKRLVQRLVNASGFSSPAARELVGMAEAIGPDGALHVRPSNRSAEAVIEVGATMLTSHTFERVVMPLRSR